jgi:hypothetical protein|nr:MAG TPA: hypothetical protein [Bacteriophage sp.]
MATIEQEQQRLFRAVWRLEISLRKVLKRTPICTLIFVMMIAMVIVAPLYELLKEFIF